MRTLFLALFTLAILTISVHADDTPFRHFTSDFNSGSLEGLTLADPLAEAGHVEPGEMRLNDQGQLVVTGHSNGNFPAGRSRAAAVPDGLQLEDFQIETDVLSWEPTGAFRNVMLMGRVRQIGFGTMDAYMALYHTGDRRLEIWRVTDEMSFVNLGNSPSFEAPTKGFRFIFTGRGNELTAQVESLDGEVLVSTTATDDTFTEGSIGIGVVGDSTAMTATFDNFRIFDPNKPPMPPAAPEPISISWVSFTAGMMTLGVKGAGDGDSVSIEDSADLHEWTTHESGVVQEGRLVIATDGAQAQRYYRVQRP